MIDLHRRTHTQRVRNTTMAVLAGAVVFTAGAGVGSGSAAGVTSGAPALGTALAARYQQASRMRTHYYYKKAPDPYSIYAVISTWYSPSGAAGNVGGAHICMRAAEDGPPVAFYGDFDSASGLFVGRYAYWGGVPFPGRILIRTTKKRIVLYESTMQDGAWGEWSRTVLPAVPRQRFAHVAGTMARTLTKQCS